MVVVGERMKCSESRDDSTMSSRAEDSEESSRRWAMVLALVVGRGKSISSSSCGLE